MRLIRDADLAYPNEDVLLIVAADHEGPTKELIPVDVFEVADRDPGGHVDEDRL